jgi:hypothetical protein
MIRRHVSSEVFTGSVSPASRIPALLWQTSIERLHRGLVGHVDGERRGLAAELAGRALRGPGVDVRDRNAAALLGQASCRGQADAAGAARDHAHLVLNSTRHQRIKRERGACRAGRRPAIRVRATCPR